jgi:tetratricopeptide (TPR) repeat protein/uncharacterized caspase-like protein
MRLAAFFLITALGAAAQQAPSSSQSQKKERDLRVETGEPKTTDATAIAPPVIPRSYALIVGIANYPKLPERAQLEYSERDAQAIYSILISPEGGNFRAENVKRLIGPQATLANLKRELEIWLPSVAKPEDRVVIYFAGHGFVHRDRAYLAPVDIDPKNIAGTGYPMDTLGEVIGSRIKARWKVVLTDSCHSGAISPSGAVSDEETSRVNRSLMGLHQSVFSLTASRDRERSFESKDWGGGHGIFTYYVVKGLEGEADESGDGIVTADELAEYVRRNVREATKGAQNPTSDRGSFDSNMLLAYNASSVRSAKLPPPKDGTLIIEVNQDNVEVFVDGKSMGVVNKGTPLRVPGLRPGAHTVQGVKQGYEPDGPREETVYPGQESTVSIRILVARRRPRAAVDAFEKGIEYYNKGFEENYRRASEQFQRALAADANYSQAALFLGRAQHALFEPEKAKQSLQRALQIDPDYVEARVSYAGILLDTGEMDEAIRQLTRATDREPKNGMAWYLLAQAFRMKESYSQGIDAGRKAVELTPANAEAHFWLAENYRLAGKYSESIREYQDYLRLSDFDSGMAGKLNYYVVGFLAGMGKKRRATQQDTWRDLRSLAYFGLCDAERKLSRFDSAIGYCQRSLSFDAKDPYAHYAIALSYARKAEQTGSLETLAAARKHFQAMLEINPDLAEAQFARRNVTAIDQALAR